jgi:putative DNA primase/helicase
MTAAEGIASALGGAYRSGRWYRARCPAHASRGPTLALRDAAGGLVVHCHAGCDPRNILAELRRRSLIDGEGGENARLDPAAVERHREAETRERQQRITLARDMVAESLPAGGTVVEHYLREARKVCGAKPVPPSIRYLPMASAYAWHPPSGGRRPVMLAVVQHIKHGIVGVHRTWLALDGSAKASLDPVRMSTGPIRGGAVPLAPAADELLIAEGIETALAGSQATGMAAWATLSTSGMVALVLPALVRTVIILADHDASRAGERAARTAASRWEGEARRVSIWMSPRVGEDANDCLLAAFAAEVRDAA